MGGKGDAEWFDVAGVTRVVEATYGSPAKGGNNWRLHIHAVVFTPSALDSGLHTELPAEWEASLDRDWLSRCAFAARVHARWSAGLMKAGYGQPGSVAVDVREIGDGGAEYLGQYLAKATYESATNIGQEVAAGQSMKTARVARNRTPFELLAHLAASVDARGCGVRTPRHWSVIAAGNGDWAVLDADTGEVIAVTPPGEWAVWHEWEQTSKGRRQLIWSRRRLNPTTPRETFWNTLLSVCGETADETDEAVAVEDLGGEAIGEIGRSDWYRVVPWRPELMVQILEAAEAGGAAAVSALVSSEGVKFTHTPPGPVAARRVSSRVHRGREASPECTQLGGAAV
ncbi:MAG: hypothetical protein ACJ74F_13680 [Mycobacterium sp.]|uniref:hypothetical protein n=1 Tax=Mycobacterium sp. TaxID=1785 RepID=UPI003899E2AB